MELKDTATVFTRQRQKIDVQAEEEPQESAQGSREPTGASC